MMASLYQSGSRGPVMSKSFSTRRNRTSPPPSSWALRSGGSRVQVRSRLLPTLGMPPSVQRLNRNEQRSAPTMHPLSCTESLKTEGTEATMSPLEIASLAAAGRLAVSVGPHLAHRSYGIPFRDAAMQPTTCVRRRRTTKTNRPSVAPTAPYAQGAPRSSNLVLSD
jgi:hypothetical protein